ncbi:MAG: AAC(3) family N-acetyltransferase [Anaerolineales bacterium]|nr:AAC(3) family N-acetyltransferase [Anaerolineales bacterium]
MNDRFQNDLLALGVRRGGVLLVHSSLRSLGNILGRAETVITGILNVLGDDGTLLMPALSYEHVTPDHPYFDVNQTPSNVGALPEFFRLRKGTLRSVHPTHSVGAAGKFASLIIERHIEDTTPCGPNSPFHLLPKYDGQILMLGCGLEPNTSMHAIEELVEPPYLYKPPMEYHLTLTDGAVIMKTYKPHNFRGYEQRYERIEQIMTQGLRHERVLNAECYLIEAKSLWDFALNALRHDPLCFVSKTE